MSLFFPCFPYARMLVPPAIRSIGSLRESA